MKLVIAALTLLVLWWCTDLVVASRTRFPTVASTTRPPKVVPTMRLPTVAPTTTRPSSGSPSNAPTQTPVDSPVKLTKIPPPKKGAAKERCKDRSHNLIYDQNLGVPSQPSISADGKTIIYTTFLNAGLPIPMRRAYTVVLSDNTTHFIQTQALTGYGLERVYGGDGGDFATISADGSTIAVSVPEEGHAAGGYPLVLVGAIYFYGWNIQNKSYQLQSGPVRASDYVVPAYPFGGYIKLGQVELSADGNTALVGGYNDQGAAKEIVPSGAAWIFVRNALNKTWSQQGPKLTGLDFVTSIFGVTYALSASGNIAFVSGESSGIVFARMNGVWKLQTPIYFQGVNQYLTGMSPNGRFVFVTTTPSGPPERKLNQKDYWVYSVWIYDRDKNWGLIQGIHSAWYVGSVGNATASYKSVALIGTNTARMMLFQDNNATGRFVLYSSLYGAPARKRLPFTGNRAPPRFSANGYTVAAEQGNNGRPGRWTCAALQNSLK